jgi:hypothetical protein
VDDFYEFLEKSMDTLGDDKLPEKIKIKAEFTKMLGRPLQE